MGVFLQLVCIGVGGWVGVRVGGAAQQANAACLFALASLVAVCDTSLAGTPPQPEGRAGLHGLYRSQASSPAQQICLFTHAPVRTCVHSDITLPPPPPLSPLPLAGKNSNFSWLGIRGTPASLQDCLRVFTADETLEVWGDALHYILALQLAGTLFLFWEVRLRIFTADETLEVRGANSFLVCCSATAAAFAAGWCLLVVSREGCLRVAAADEPREMPRSPSHVSPPLLSLSVSVSDLQHVEREALRCEARASNSSPVGTGSNAWFLSCLLCLSGRGGVPLRGMPRQGERHQACYQASITSWK